jgi:hypothetical protein
LNLASYFPFWGGLEHAIDLTPEHVGDRVNVGIDINGLA